MIVLGPQGRNLSAPTSLLASSGWQWEGAWGGGAGTAIGPHTFISAAHVGGGAGQPFLLNGTTYTTTGGDFLPGTDLAVWQTAETFPTYAPLYEGAGEVGQTFVVYGRGTSRGDVVTVNGHSAGWYWGAGDGAMSWGVNTFDGTFTAPGLGDLLTFSFTDNGDPNTGILSGGDSGGGVFINDNGVWKLAGMNYGVDLYYSRTGQDADRFAAAIYDGRGLFLGQDGNYDLIDPALPEPFGQRAAVSRVSSSLARIRSDVSAGEPSPFALVGLTLLLRPWRRRRKA